MADSALARPGMAQAITRSDLMHNRLPENEIEVRVRASFDRERTGHVYLVPAPGWIQATDPADLAAMHGTPYAYDRLYRSRSGACGWSREGSRPRPTLETLRPPWRRCLGPSHLVEARDEYCWRFSPRSISSRALEGRVPGRSGRVHPRQNGARVEAGGSAREQNAETKTRDLELRSGRATPSDARDRLCRRLRGCLDRRFFGLHLRTGIGCPQRQLTSLSHDNELDTLVAQSAGLTVLRMVSDSAPINRHQNVSGSHSGTMGGAPAFHAKDRYTFVDSGHPL